ncbi:helix-turn-helix domain-containing protein [uncultured Dokdonia sp.]|uniref:helix-turn-helix domain-containing protein n=1 Tax=uncultured Dokdonia sp. TaxID=575653 RepID=UPI002615D344|nr:helix-turn-helix domain-containing protein [uncultured Dokdonia sp.]
MKEEIIQYDFKEDLPYGFEIVDIKKLYKNNKHHLVKSHRTDFYQIVWFVKGTVKHIVDFQTIDITPNTLLFINKGSVQQFDTNESFEAFSFLFTDDFFCQSEIDATYLKSTILFNDLFSISKIQIPKTSNSFYMLFQLMEDELAIVNDVYQTTILKNLIHNFLVVSEREYKKQDFIEVVKSKDLQYVLDFKKYLEIHYTSEKTVSFYAEELNITTKRLLKATTKIHGKSPKEIIDYRVILEVKRLLSHTDQSIKEIAFLVGFNEPTNFVKYFRKHNNSTPASFRKQFSYT